MSEFNISIEGGTSYRLHTAGKFCDRDIVVTAEGGGDTSVEDMLVADASFDKYSNDRVTRVARYAFYNRNVKDVYLPNVKSVGDYSFYKASPLHIKESQFPALLEIGTAAFAYSQVYTVVLPSVERISGSAFNSCDNLYSAIFQSAEMLGVGCFAKCTALRDIEFPKVTSVDINCFDGCRNLRKVVFPSLIETNQHMFRDCTSLEIADFPVCETIATETFAGCTSLKAILLRTTTTVAAVSLDAISDTPIFTGGGYLYIPSVMWDAYAQFYGDYMAIVRRLEDYTVDSTITGELDESKI